MRDIIAEILAAEAEGSRLKAAAAARALELVSAAKKKAVGLSAAGLEEARREADRVSAAAHGNIAREKAARLEAAGAEINRELDLDEAARRRAAEVVARRVLGIQGEM